MRFQLSDLWRWDGNVDRGTYAMVGILGFALKHNLDRFVATGFFGRRWSLFNYLAPLEGGDITALGPADLKLYATLLLVAIPFIWIGLALTLSRLRSAALPSGLVVFFFAPVVNLLFFLVLCLLPSRDAVPALPRPGFLDRFPPKDAGGSAALAMLLTVPLALAGALLGMEFFSRYGWSLFLGLPFALGFTATLIYGYHRPRGYWSCIGVALLAAWLLGVALLALAIEGLICVLMAGPIMLIFAALGGTLGYFLQRRPGALLDAPALLAVLGVFLPILMGAERADPPAAPLLSVTTAVEVNAPPERVWASLVAFSEMAPPEDWLFRAGIAYPIRAELIGTGPGAIRHCVFSTGAFVEPIEVWEAPRLLRFSVSSQPAPLQEWTPYADVQPPHLDYLRSERGQFLLTPLSGGRTRLEGTTWYRHAIWPASYWRLWSDAIIHKIHARVLHHIQGVAEGAATHS